MNRRKVQQNKFSNIYTFLLCAFLMLQASCLSPRYKAITGYHYKWLNTYQEGKELRLPTLHYIEIAEGILIARLENPTLPLIATIAKVNLKTQNLKIVATGAERFKSKGRNKGFVTAETTLSFAKRHDTNLAINANFFTFNTSYFDPLYKPLGLFINGGKLFSPCKKDFASCVFDSANIAMCGEFSTERAEQCAFECELLGNARLAISGYNRVIAKGRNILQGASRKVDSRTLIGVNERGDELIILMIDGERRNLSRGLTLFDATHLLLQLGVMEGIELDGGGSSTLVAKIAGKQEQLVPSSKKQIRRVAINLGFISALN